MLSSFRSRHARTAATAAVMAAALVGPGKAAASNWDFDPRIEMGGEYNDNYRLAVEDTPKIPAYGSLVDASFTARLLDPRSEIDIVPRIHSSFLPDDHEDQSTDGYLDVTGNYRTQRATFGGTFSYANETVISSELLPADFPGVGLGQVQGEAGGIVSVHNRRELERVAPNMTFDFTPRYHLKMNAEYENISFSHNFVENEGTNNVFAQEGFKDFYGSAGLQYDFSQRYDLVMSLLGSKFLPDGSNTDTDSVGVQAQWDGRPSSIVTYYARVGVDEVHAHTAVDGNIDKTLVVGGAGVTWTYQLTQFIADAMRDLSPSAAGAVVEHDEVRLRMLHALTPRLYTVLAARYVRVRGASQTILGIVGSDYAAGSAALQYQLTRNWRLATEYDYTWQRFEGTPQAMSNGISLSVIWQPLSKYNPLPDYTRLPLDRPQ
jgi:hypothetical protein